MIKCTISIWGNPSGRGYIARGRDEGNLMTQADCDLRNIDGDSVYRGEYYSVMYTDRGYVISHHYTLENDGVITPEFGGVISFRDPRTVTSIAVPRGYCLEAPVEIFDRLRQEYGREIRKLINIDELSNKISQAVPDWESLVLRNICPSTVALRVNASDERARGFVTYSNLGDVDAFLTTLERQSYKGYQVIYFIPQASVAYFIGLTNIPALPSFVPSYKVLLPDGTQLEIKSLDEPIDVTITRPDHMDLRLQGTIASKMTEWAIRPSADGSEYVVGVQPVPLKKIVPIECMDIGTGLPKSDLKMLKPTVGKIEGSALVLTGDEISQARMGIDVIVEAPYRRVSIRTEGDQQKVIKLEIVQVVSFNADEYIRRIISEYGFTPEIYCNEERVFGVIQKDFNIARNCRITIKGSEDYETYEMMMPTDGWAPSSITLQKREGRKIPFEVQGLEAQDAFKRNGKIYVESDDDDEREEGKGKKKEASKTRVKPKKHIFTLTPGNMSVEFKQSDMTSERMYKAELEGFRPVSFRLPKRFFGRPIELEFRPTAGTKFKKNRGWIALIVLAFLLGIGAGYGLKCLIEHYQEQKAAEQELAEDKDKLAELTKNLTTVTFTSSDISALETFINEHEELKDEPEIKTAQDHIKIARSIISFCSGDDNAVDKLSGASTEQAELINAIKEMPELKSVKQNSDSLEDLKNELEAVHEAEAQAAADVESAKSVFNNKCKPLARLDCTIDQLDDIIDWATKYSLTKDERYKQALNLRRCIYKMTKRNSSGDPNPEQSGDDVLATIRNRIKNKDVPSEALEFFESLNNDTAVHAALPLDPKYNSLDAISKAIYGQ